MGHFVGDNRNGVILHIVAGKDYVLHPAEWIDVPVRYNYFAAGSNTLNGINFSASDTDEANAESLKKAVADARAKAEVLAEAAGMKITGIESISEGGVYSYTNTVGNFSAKGAFDDVEEAEAGTVVQAAKLLVNATVTITFTVE